MGSAKKERAQTKRAAKQTGTVRQVGPAGRGGRAPSGLFASASTLGAHTFPFGADGPILEVQRRCTSTVTVCVHGFWLLFMVGTLLALGLSGFSLFCHWVWLLSTLFAGATFAGYWVAQQHEAWLIFWSLWMIHGLLWLQLVLVASKGVWPGTLWANFETHSGTDLLMSQLGSVPLLILPLVAFLAFVWFERSYLQIIYYDFTSQLEPQHRIYNWLWHLTSPSVPLAVWAYFLNPKIFTDLPRWPGMLPVVPTMLISNGLLLYFFHRNTREYIGSVRWLHGVWLVWRKPRDLAARSKAS